MDEPRENALFEHVLLRWHSRRGPAAFRLRHLRHVELEPRLDEFGVVQRETDWLALVFGEKLRIEHLEPDALAVGPVLRDSQVANVEREAARRRFGQGLESNLHDVGSAGQRLALGGLEHRQRGTIGFGGLRGETSMPVAWGASEALMARILACSIQIASIGYLDIADVQRPRRTLIEQERDAADIVRVHAAFDQRRNRQTQRLHHDLAGAEDDVRIDEPMDRAPG